MSFNLVIERLLISGILTEAFVVDVDFVSISLSSGFSFQVASGWHGAIDLLIVSISLSSGFSFQGTENRAPKVTLTLSFNLVIERLLISGTPLYFERNVLGCFNLVIERLLISGFTR